MNPVSSVSSVTVDNDRRLKFGMLVTTKSRIFYQSPYLTELSIYRAVLDNVIDILQSRKSIGTSNFILIAAYNCVKFTNYENCTKADIIQQF